jgi:hypothetical protein
MTFRQLFDMYPFLAVFVGLCAAAFPIGLYVAAKGIAAEREQRARAIFRQCGLQWRDGI